MTGSLLEAEGHEEDVGKIVALLGPPGSGKGTQARQLAGRFRLPQISTGDLLREIASQDTPLGKAVREIQSRGELVSDDILTDVLRTRAKQSDCAGGYLLDGYPRTVAQAETLARLAREEGHSVDVIHIEVSPAALVDRLTGRRICPGCGEIYHARFRPPKIEGVCDRSGDLLIQRSDDRVEAVSNRLEVYRKQTSPVIEFYRQRGELKVVGGEREPSEVFRDLSALVASSGTNAGTR